METTTSPWFTRRFMSSFPGFFQRICPTKRPPTKPIGSCLLNASRIPKAINKCHINLPIVHQILMDTSHLGKFPFIVFPNMHACTANQDFFSPKSKRGIYDSLCQQTRKDKTNGFSLPPNEISILLPLFFQALEQPCRIFFLLFDRSKHFLFISNVGCTFPSLTIENQSIFLNNSNRSALYLPFFGQLFFLLLS